jgi:hypothetical protein
LNELCAKTGCHRKHTIRLLNWPAHGYKLQADHRLYLRDKLVYMAFAVECSAANYRGIHRRILW